MTKSNENITICTFCDQPATGYTVPPMCEKHETLATMITFVQVNDDIENVRISDLLQLLDQAEHLAVDRYDVLDLAPKMPGVAR